MKSSVSVSQLKSMFEFDSKPSENNSNFRRATSMGELHYKNSPENQMSTNTFIRYKHNSSQSYNENNQRPSNDVDTESRRSFGSVQDLSKRFSSSSRDSYKFQVILLLETLKFEITLDSSHTDD